ncbi:sushi, von Willebrand factor type A, EGF and pentraxin domain-containing protein 1-like [Dreissena polymorpha]|nr:sushi, von Willebrand factor type A, EGF and pentraxin domain-containing protein 1-like [Dreissena polymorpha]
MCGGDGKWYFTGQTCEPVDCKSFPTLQNGNIVATNTTIGSTSKITCDIGYILSGSLTSTCDVNGLWSSTNQSCKPVDCYQLPIPPHGMVSPVATATTFGTVVTITCDTGFNLTGNSTSTCDSKGNWSSIGHKCDLVQCGNLSEPEHGIIKSTSTSYGSEAIVACHLGYNLLGQNTSTCGSNGKWDNVGQICKAVDCGKFPDLLNGTTDAENTTFGSIVSLMCNEGFDLIGDSHSVCTSTGGWNTTGQVCQPLDCGPLPILSNGTAHATNTTFGSVAIFTCDEGFNLTGHSFTVCGSNGFWNITDQTCYIIDCGPLPTLSHGTVRTENSTFGSIAVLHCVEGFNLTGSSVSMCTSNGVWNSTGPKCSPIDCGRVPELINGTIYAENTTFESVALLTCDKGFILTGSNRSMCTISGLWNMTGQMCDPIDCGLLPALNNGSINYIENTTFDSIAVMTCDAGFSLTGDTFSVCNSSGGWNTTGQTCNLIDCGPLPIFINGTAHATNTTYGSVAIFTCDEGFNLTGNSHTVCGSNGIWNTIDQTCTIIDCGNLPALNNGSIMYIENTTFDSIAVLTCNAGFNLTGERYSVCNGSGVWNTTGQTCNHIDCGPLPQLLNGSVSADSSIFGSVALFTCDEGFTLFGSNLSVCSNNSNWNYTGQTCQRIDCGKLPTLLNGTIAYTNNTTHGSIAILTCEGGFDLIGNTTSVCTTRGIWDSTDQSCSLKDCRAFPSLWNGFVTHSQNTTFGSRVFLKCDEGFYLSGSIYSECNSSGFWSYTDQTCNLIDCGPIPTLNHGTVHIENTTFESTAVFTCDKGFSLTGDVYSVCTGAGIWNSTHQTCNPIDCGPFPEIANGTISYSNNTTFGSVADVKCDEGFYLTGKINSECIGDGTWNSSGQKCKHIDCGPYPDLINGTVYTNNTLFGSIAVLKCDKGFNLTGHNYSECTTSGMWNSTAQICDPIDCGPFLELINGTAATNDTKLGSVAVLMCNEGFNLTGSEYSECISNGTWKLTGQHCNPIDCGSFPELINGTVTTDSTKFGSIAVLTCDDGFNLSGNNFSTCTSSGTWNATTQICKQFDCGPFPVPSNGSVYTQSTTFGSVAYMTCKDGFILSGDRMSACNSSGNWNITGQTCEPIDCGPLASPGDGYLIGLETTYGHVFRVYCNTGYHLNGNDISSCGSDGNWTNTNFSCTLIDCGEVNPPINGTISRGATTYGSVVTITCNSGNKLIGNNTSLCQHTGIWSHENFTCKYVDCGPLHKPLGSYVTPLDTSYGTLASIKCNIGYQLFGNDTSFCDTDGNWTSTNFTCNIIDCGRPPEIKNGRMNFSATVFQSNANVMCDTGYALSRSNTFLICLSNGSWSFYEFQCNPVDCGDLTTRGHQQITYAGNKTTFGTQAIMVCDIGYRLTNRPGVQSEAAVCNASGHWSIPHFSTCESIVCPSLNISWDIMDMNATTKGPYTANMAIQFTCKAGFTVNGFDNIICLSNGKWSGETPKCKKENKVYPNCTKKESWDETSPGGIRTQTCPGNSIGVVSRTCSPKGEWMQPVDGCVRKEIETISLQIEAIKYNPTQESITDSLNQLSNVTNISQNEQGENKVNTISVTSGELEKVTNILDTIVNASANINITDVTNNQVQKFLQTTSNILDASNTDSWKSIEQNNNNQDKSAVKVLQVVDRYIGVISKYINSSQNGSITVNTTNLVMHVSRIEKHTPYIQFPEENPGNFKTVYLPKSSLENASSFSAVVYKNLSGILSSNTVDNTSDAKSVISSEVISVNLDNWQSNPNFNISLTLAYFQTNSGQPKCTFWNMSRSAWDTNGCTLAIQGSNSSMCVCNHLTNFAILMSPWTENVDTTALDVISIVGCSISMLGLIITVVVHFHLWRYVRSDRVVILMNLSIALISSYAVFIGGVDRTENKALCTVMAVLLQYIYLVVFFLMLAEGIEIGITVLYVFVTKSRLKWILPAAWALPAVIVGVSMGATKLEGYGNTKFCWLSMEGGLIWAFVAPAMLIILVNFVVLILVIRTMFRSKTLSEKSRSERSKAGVRCMCVLLPLMGCTWVMGLLYVNESMAWVQYVFAVCNSLQGLVIFVFHCVLNVQIRNALLRRKHRKQSKSFISTNSASFVSTRVTEEPVALPKINLSTAKRTARGSLHSADDATGDVLQASGRTEINNVDTLF